MRQLQTYEPITPWPKNCRQKTLLLAKSSPTYDAFLLNLPFEKYCVGLDEKQGCHRSRFAMQN
jgi:hypothetical protein